VTRLAVVGGGRMGEALVAGALRSGVSASQLRVVEASPDRAAFLLDRYGVSTTGLDEGVVRAETVVVAVKPGDVATVLADAGPLLAEDAVLVSVAAGVTLSTLEALLPGGTAVVRAMPNTPALVGKGMTALSLGTAANGGQMRRVTELFSAVGEVVEVPEAWMDAVTAVSGSGPAYLFYLVEAMVDGAVRLGLPREVARQLSVQTVRGAGEMLTVTGDHPVQLREAVSSPGGTTVAAIGELEEGAVRAHVARAMAAAARRSAELGTPRAPAPDNDRGRS